MCCLFVIVCWLIVLLWIVAAYFQFGHSLSNLLSSDKVSDLVDMTYVMSSYELELCLLQQLKDNLIDHIFCLA